ncbi:MAG: ankyrin repeat domain-containing protein [Candidatus Hydrogenedentes bacterium]|nr:ankyrin repeat domain-containing protein [Candidatus Hydrogenedentota bacterium]
MRGLILGTAFCFLFVAMLSGCSGGSTPLQEEQRDISGMAPIQVLCAAAYEGQLDEVKNLLAADPSLINAKGELGRTALHAAAGGGQSGIVDYLLSQGADPTITDEDGNSPASAALEFAHTGIAKTLREAEVKALEAGGAAAPAAPPAQ